MKVPRHAAIAVILVGAALAATVHAFAKPNTDDAPIVHVVLFSLNDQNESAATALIADARSLLAKLPTVVDLKVGTRMPSSRDNHVKDYDVGLYIQFRRPADLQAYLVDPKHLELVSRYKERLASVRVIDFFDALPAK